MLYKYQRISDLFSTTQFMVLWLFTSISSGWKFLPDEREPNLKFRGIWAFCDLVSLSYCNVPLTLTSGSSCGNPVVPWRPTHIPSPLHCEPWCPLGSLEAILTCDVRGAEAEAELNCVPAWSGALEKSLPRMGFPRKGLALAEAALCSWESQVLPSKGPGWLRSLFSIGSNPISGTITPSTLLTPLPLFT